MNDNEKFWTSALKEGYENFRGLDITDKQCGEILSIIKEKDREYANLWRQFKESERIKLGIIKNQAKQIEYLDLENKTRKNFIAKVSQEKAQEAIKKDQEIEKLKQDLRHYAINVCPDKDREIEEKDKKYSNLWAQFKESENIKSGIIENQGKEIAELKETLEARESTITKISLSDQEHSKTIAELKEKLSALKPNYLDEECWEHVLKDIVKRAKETGSPVGGSSHKEDNRQ
jgi:hypothetical protein